MKRLELILSILILTNKHFTSADEPCDSCTSVEITSTSDAVHRKHGELLGNYRKVPELLNKFPVFKHYSGKFFLYYNVGSQGFWAVGETLGSDVVRLENQGDRVCPYFLKSLWRYADGELNALVYDVTLQIVCLTEPCSVANCGFQASCVEENNQTQCQCNRGYIGNPYERYSTARHKTNANYGNLVFD